MKFSVGVVLTALILLTAGTSHADTLPADPRISLGHGTGSTGVGLDFSFNLHKNGNKFDGSFDFFNATPFTWTALEFSGTSDKPNEVTCSLTDHVLFNQCEVEPPIQVHGKNYAVTILYFNGDIFPNEHFIVNFNDPADPKHLWKSKSIDAHAFIASTPEPSVFLLLVSGLLILPLLGYLKAQKQIALNKYQHTALA